MSEALDKAAMIAAQAFSKLVDHIVDGSVAVEDVEEAVDAGGFLSPDGSDTELASEADMAVLNRGRGAGDVSEEE
jgi:hypothetical protein